MIFATDLDRTLIYSLAASEGSGQIGDRELGVVEYLDGLPMSYMTRRAVTLLRALWTEVRVVPVTTRTLAQYRRIDLIGSAMAPEYAVAANGGHVLHRGAPDLDWYGAIRAEVSGSCTAADEIASQVADAGRTWASRVRVADGLFVYAIVDRGSVVAHELAELARRAKSSGWELSLQGRKLYAVPRPLDKWRAVAEVCRRTGDGVVAAAGDSLLDRCLLDNCVFSMRPAHGELEVAGYPADFVTTSSGATAAEELLEAALAWARAAADLPRPQ